MASNVVLECTGGKLLGTRFAFAERATCVLGRSPDCYLRIADEGDTRFISRYHCLLDINPPDVRVRDFGSLNGTFVNGIKIGQRSGEKISTHEPPPEFSEHPLSHGDRLRVADCEFRVIIEAESRCDSCGRDLVESEVSHASHGSGQTLCTFCREDASAVAVLAPSDASQCASCGSHVPTDATRMRNGAVLCPTCRDNPQAVVDKIIKGDDAEPGGHSTLQGYQIVRQLGRGGMGAVYLARNTKTGRDVAIKILLPRVAVNPYAVKMFEREINITRRLDHPNIVKLVDSGFANGAFFLCVEYCAGGTVNDLMKSKDGRLSVQDALAVTWQVLDALEFAHGLRARDAEPGKTADAHIIHRDVKPNNMLLVKPGSTASVKLGDFGLSKAFDMTGLSGLTLTGEACGTPFFICRQQVLNYKHAKREVDLWATAASMYNMLTGTYPREFPKGKDIWQVVLQTDPIPIRKRRHDLPKPLADFIDQALRDRPDLRYQSVDAFRKALRKAAG